MARKSNPKILGVSVLFSGLAMIIGFFAIFTQSQTKTYLADNIAPTSVSDSFDNTDLAGTFDGKPVKVPIEIAQNISDRKILGIDLVGNKTIHVDLNTQTLTAYENGRAILQTFISSGKWFPTPTGIFHIWGKFRFTKMSGGQGSDYYYLPNVPYVMFFDNNQIAAIRGFSLHGTYWHNNFGHPMSHGCVNMRTSDAGVLFNWTGPTMPEGKNSVSATSTNPGTEIIITGTAPAS